MTAIWPGEEALPEEAYEIACVSHHRIYCVPSLIYIALCLYTSRPKCHTYPADPTDEQNFPFDADDTNLRHANENGQEMRAS